MIARLTPRRWMACLLACAALAVGCALLSVIVSAPASAGTSLPWRDALRALGGGGDEVSRLVVWKARVPRTALASACGACLAVAGALLQLVLRNPLADPYVLGVSSGAALGSVAGLALGATLGGAGHPLAAIAGAALAALLVHAIGRDREGRLGVERLLLAGVVLSYLLSAGLMWIVSLAPAQQGQRLLFWLMGSFGNASALAAGAVACALALALAIVATALPALDLLAVSEEHAADSGVQVEAVKRRALGSAAILTGASVAAAGSIGFVGLVVPHGVRLVLGGDARLLVPASALAGASFLACADMLVRVTGEMPVGVVTASCGAPFFLWLLWRGRG